MTVYANEGNAIQAPRVVIEAIAVVLKQNKKLELPENAE